MIDAMLMPVATLARRNPGASPDGPSLPCPYPPGMDDQEARIRERLRCFCFPADHHRWSAHSSGA
jgi:hypothetical protein